MTPRDAWLALWIGSSLEPCAPTYKGAITLHGIAVRIDRDLGILYSETEIRAALAAEGIAIDDTGRVAKLFATTWTPRACAASAALTGQIRGAR